MRLELELRDRPVRAGAVEQVEEVRDPFRRGAEALQPLVRPRRIGAAGELRQHRLAEEQRDVQLVAVLRDQERLVGAGLGREPVPQRRSNQVVPRLRRFLHAMRRHEEPLQLGQRIERLHWTNRPLGTARTAGTPLLDSNVASRGLPVVIHFS